MFTEDEKALIEKISRQEESLEGRFDSIDNLRYLSNFTAEHLQILGGCSYPVALSLLSKIEKAHLAAELTILGNIINNLSPSTPAILDKTSEFAENFSFRSNRPLLESDIPLLSFLMRLRSQNKIKSKNAPRTKNQSAENLFRSIPYEGEKDGGFETDYFLIYCYSQGIGTAKSETEAFTLLKKIADKGHAISQNNVGYAFAKGYGVKKSTQNAYCYFLKAAQNKEPAALYNLAICYLLGYGTEESEHEGLQALYQAHLLKDKVSSRHLLQMATTGNRKVLQDHISIWKKLAEEGNILVQWHLGVFFSQPGGDVKEGFKFLKIFADRGAATAQYFVGSFFQVGWGIETSMSEAIRYFKMAADQEYSPAIHALGICFEKGEGVEQSDAIALQLYLQGAEKRWPESQIKMAEFFSEGRNVVYSREIARDHLKSAFESYKRVADGGNTYSQIKVAVMYAGGIGVEQSDEQSYDYFMKSSRRGGERGSNLSQSVFACLKQLADEGDSLSQVLVAERYRDGKGVQKSLSQACNYLKLAADQGNIKAQIALAHCYRLGYGVNKSLELAYRYYKKAAELHSARGQYYTGLCLRDGLGTPSSKTKAFQYFELAAKQGYAQAQFMMACCYYRNEGVEITNEEAYQYCLSAANNGFLKAFFCLGYIFEHGSGEVPKDLSRALYYYKIAASKGLQSAEEKVKNLTSSDCDKGEKKVA
jgi:TPR repeat protein